MDMVVKKEEPGTDHSIKVANEVLGLRGISQENRSTGTKESAGAAHDGERVRPFTSSWLTADAMTDACSDDTQTTFSDIPHPSASHTFNREPAASDQEGEGSALAGSDCSPSKRSRPVVDSELLLISPQESGLMILALDETLAIKKPKFGSFTTDVRHQALLLQKQLSMFTRTLEEGRAYDKEVDQPISSGAFPLQDAAQLEVEKMRKENDKLQQINANLRKELSSACKANDSLKADLEMQSQPGELDRLTMGIDPQLVQTIAADLAVGARDSSSVADALFDLVEKAVPLVTDPAEYRRYNLAPRERLRNLEGVVDVSLGRVEKLEEKIKAMQYPSWFGNNGIGSTNSYLVNTQRSTSRFSHGSSSDDEDTEDGRSQVEQRVDQK